MRTKLSRVTLTFRSDGAVDAVFIRKQRDRRHEIRARLESAGWAQWGADDAILSENVRLVERTRTLLREEGLL